MPLALCCAKVPGVWHAVFTHKFWSLPRAWYPGMPCRDLSKPMGALNASRLAKFWLRFEEMPRGEVRPCQVPASLFPEVTGVHQGPWLLHSGPGLQLVHMPQCLDASLSPVYVYCTRAQFGCLPAYQGMEVCRAWMHLSCMAPTTRARAMSCSGWSALHLRISFGAPGRCYPPPCDEKATRMRQDAGVMQIFHVPPLQSFNALATCPLGGLLSSEQVLQDTERATGSDWALGLQIAGWAV